MSVPVALVTGAAHRLGRALALGFAKESHDLAVHFRSDSAAAKETCRQVAEWGVRAETFRSDLGADGGERPLVERVLEKFGRLDVLVHSASPWISGPVSKVTLEDWEAAFRAGPRAAFFLAQAASPALAANEGSILLISDVAGTKAWANHVPHAVAKAAINALVLNLAVALAPIRVNGIAPGLVLPPGEMPAHEIERLVSRLPLRRVVAPDDLVSLAVAVATNRSTTGQVLAVDCGQSARAG